MSDTIRAGRPSDYSEELASKICELIADGQSLRAICAPDDMPNRSSVFLWLAKHKVFSDQYARAREEQAETLADEIIGIADESYNDHDVDDNGNVRVNSEAIQRSKLRVEARKWVVSKLKPKKYGEFTRTEVTGRDGAPVETVTTIRIVAGDGSNSTPTA